MMNLGDLSTEIPEFDPMRYGKTDTRDLHRWATECETARLNKRLLSLIESHGLRRAIGEMVVQLNGEWAHESNGDSGAVYARVLFLRDLTSGFVRYEDPQGEYVRLTDADVYRCAVETLEAREAEAKAAHEQREAERRERDEAFWTEWGKFENPATGKKLIASTVEKVLRKEGVGFLSARKDDHYEQFNGQRVHVDFIRVNTGGKNSEQVAQTLESNGYKAVYTEDYWVGVRAAFVPID